MQGGVEGGRSRGGCTLGIAGLLPHSNSMFWCCTAVWTRPYACLSPPLPPVTGDVGFMEASHLRRILAACNRTQLEAIEDATL